MKVYSTIAYSHFPGSRSSASDDCFAEIRYSGRSTFPSGMEPRGGQCASGNGTGPYGPDARQLGKLLREKKP